MRQVQDSQHNFLLQFLRLGHCTAPTSRQPLCCLLLHFQALRGAQQHDACCCNLLSLGQLRERSSGSLASSNAAGGAGTPEGVNGSAEHSSYKKVAILPSCMQWIALDIVPSSRQLGLLVAAEIERHLLQKATFPDLKVSHTNSCSFSQATNISAGSVQHGM